MSIVNKDILFDKIILQIVGEFKFSIHNDLRNAYKKELDDTNIKIIEIDFSRVTTIDSSGLGMLLVLNEETKDRRIKLMITGLSNSIRSILEIANFQKIMDL